jgi:putative SOS response-associated peptidase YedK
MCGKGAVHLTWREIYSWAASLTPPSAWPADPEPRVNVSPSRLRRKSDPESMVWETLPATMSHDGADVALEATWPFLPFWSRGRLPRTRQGKILSTANARLRREGLPFAPTFQRAWSQGDRAVTWLSWFYEFDRRVHPQVPWAVFPLNLPFWPMAALHGRSRDDSGESRDSVAIITVEPNEVLRSVGHHRSPALLRDPEEVEVWLHGSEDEALELLRPYPDEAMGVEVVPMEIKIPGNQKIDLPETVAKRLLVERNPGN